VYDLEISRMRKPWPALGGRATEEEEEVEEKKKTINI
jgi:hypothetical protein